MNNLYTLLNNLRKHIAHRQNGPLAGLLASGDLSDQWLDACAQSCGAMIDFVGVALIQQIRELSAEDRIALLSLYNGKHYTSVWR